MLGDEVLRQAAAELATALNDSLPPPTECQHKFSADFEEKMQSHQGYRYQMLHSCNSGSCDP